MSTFLTTIAIPNRLPPHSLPPFPPHMIEKNRTTKKPLVCPCHSFDTSRSWVPLRGVSVCPTGEPPSSISLPGQSHRTSTPANRWAPPADSIFTAMHETPTVGPVPTMHCVLRVTTTPLSLTEHTHTHTHTHTVSIQTDMGWC